MTCREEFDTLIKWRTSPRRVSQRKQRHTSTWNRLVCANKHCYSAYHLLESLQMGDPVTHQYPKYSLYRDQGGSGGIAKDKSVCISIHNQGSQLWENILGSIKERQERCIVSNELRVMKSSAEWSNRGIIDTDASMHLSAYNLNSFY